MGELYEIIAVTDRKLCKTDFSAQIKLLAGLPIRGILLREKDLPAEEYKRMAAGILNENRGEVNLIIHSHIEIWKELLKSSHRAGLHLPFLAAKERGKGWVEHLKDYGLKDTGGKAFMLGTSVHAAGEAKQAQELGFNYLIAGHVFETDCKKGLPGRGTDFIRQICAETTLPVYGIGGISEENAKKVKEAGAFGVCQMSEVMRKSKFDEEWLRALGGHDYGRSEDW